jgi:hypothetical protein
VALLQVVADLSSQFRDSSHGETLR